MENPTGTYAPGINYHEVDRSKDTLDAIGNTDSVSLPNLRHTYGSAGSHSAPLTEDVGTTKKCPMKKCQKRSRSFREYAYDGTLSA
jgi:hypothetical protein